MSALKKTTWKNDHRPGYFGRRRDEKIAALNAQHGEGNWRLAWVPEGDIVSCSFGEACVVFYEKSYLVWLGSRPAMLDHICSYKECIDNAESNVESGCDYSIQESFSTHIQDIAVRNVLRILNRKFLGTKDELLVIRSADSSGYMYGPGNVPFYNKALITQPSMRPRWANEGSVEDFWQSNKWVQVKG